jgi:mono/diheme cytochrome c family protein
MPRTLIITILMLFLAAASVRAESDVAREARAILSSNCYACHGPDAKARKAKLRLDIADSALSDRGGKRAIVPRDLERSELWKRVTSNDADHRMPPSSTKKTLSPKDLATLKRWIEEGASFDRHWAFVPPKRPALPNVKRIDWPKNAIDHFVLARLEKEGLQPSSAAEPDRWLRRVSLDLVGLPPSPDEIDAFRKDHERDPAAARRNVVDQLLASPRFGERWAMPWLDEARYADSNGYQADQLREIWAYRDWVIRAINDDMPFDRFVTEQLAGDLLPNATDAQKIATGFHRTVTCNVEAGVDPEENRVNQVFDRVNTTATVFLGLSYECAQCHDHKYDPVSMRDYYSLFAYYNNTPLEVTLPKGGGVQYELAGPMMMLPMLPDRDARRSKVQTALDLLNEERAVAGPDRVKEIDTQLKKLTVERESLKPPSTLVMVEGKARPTHVFQRGDYRRPGDRVQPDTPETLHSPNAKLPPNRLGLAQWITSRDNPLLARVTINRWWAELFGRGIVATVEEFGIQGDPPTHPELLDWLAVELMERGWSMKHLLREIVLSATYAQSSKITPQLLERDPENKLLARGSRVRLRAESIRDLGLAASGTLSAKMFGPPVMPYQPPGLWKTTGRNAPVWKENTDEDRFRRGVYVVWRRAVPYPSFVAFDAPDRASCVVKRSRTNTPLQALALLNDPAFLEMALALAVQVQEESADDRGRLTQAWRRVLTRAPSANELDALAELLRSKLDHYRAHPEKARALLDGVRGVRTPTGSDAVHLAAWFHVANVLLNLDEAITKG